MLTAFLLTIKLAVITQYDVHLGSTTVTAPRRLWHADRSHGPQPASVLVLPSAVTSHAKHGVQPTGPLTRDAVSCVSRRLGLT
jgi:hypothetical protein